MESKRANQWCDYKSRIWTSSYQLSSSISESDILAAQYVGNSDASEWAKVKMPKRN